MGLFRIAVGWLGTSPLRLFVYCTHTTRLLIAQSGHGHKRHTTRGICPVGPVDGGFLKGTTSHRCRRPGRCQESFADSATVVRRGGGSVPLFRRRVNHSRLAHAGVGGNGTNITPEAVACCMLLLFTRRENIPGPLK